MIRIPVTDEVLRQEIESAKPGWLARAKTRTEKCRTAKAFVVDGIWSDAKPAYIKLQHRKCAYCERKLPDERWAKGEYDVEHYRPKNGVVDWPDEKTKDECKIDYNFACAAGAKKGYYLLGHDIWNYVATCRTCNSPLKLNFFPIAGTPKGNVASIKSINTSEQPFLLFPLGELDDDPADVLTFHGVLAIPKSKRGRKHRRARVCIDLFRLNLRKELIEERLRQLDLVESALSDALDPQKPAPKRERAKRKIAEHTSRAAPHSSCSAAWLMLARHQPRQAYRLILAGEAYLKSLEPGLEPRQA